MAEEEKQMESVTLSGGNRSLIISVPDGPVNYSRTISRLPTLMEELEQEQESVRGARKQERELEGEAQSFEMEEALEQEPEVNLELLRNSWTLSAANSSRVWLLGTGNTS